jgi:hypothetical protein
MQTDKQVITQSRITLDPKTLWIWPNLKQTKVKALWMLSLRTVPQMKETIWTFKLKKLKTDLEEVAPDQS